MPKRMIFLLALMETPSHYSAMGGRSLMLSGIKNNKYVYVYYATFIIRQLYIYRIRANVIHWFKKWLILLLS